MFGFFECIEEYDVAQALFHCAMRWAEQRGLNTLYGPFNLDYEDSYGILIEGRDRPPALLCGHTPPYYQGLVERFGFQRARGDNLAYAVDLGEDTPALRRLARLADALRRRGQILVRGADLAHWDDEMDRVHRLLNAALAHIPDHIPWRREVLQAMLEPFRAIVDPELILFAEVNGEVVGWFPGIANLNQVLQRANGLRYPWDYVRLWWAANSCILHWDNARMPGPMPFARRRQPECLAIKSVLVLPEYWDTGVSVLLFDEMRRRAQARGFKWVDLSLTSDDNPYTPALAEHMGARIYKRYRVYRLRFSE
jgi:GNAT superfamily N-acetyltransferase